MKKLNKLALLLIATVLLGGCAIIGKPSSPAFVFDQTEFDFEIVKQSTSKVSHQFSFTYVGEQPIKVTSLPTSCGCTVASISKVDLAKGDTGIITVVFNPNHHAEPAGKFFRTISIVTDPKITTPELKIWAQVDMDVGPQVFEMQTPDND